MPEIQPSEDAVATAISVAAYYVNYLPAGNTAEAAQLRAKLVGELAAVILEQVKDYGYAFKKA